MEACSEQVLFSKKVETLRKMLKQKKLPITGNKQALVERLLRQQSSTGQPQSTSRRPSRATPSGPSGRSAIHNPSSQGTNQRSTRQQSRGTAARSSDPKNRQRGHDNTHSTPSNRRPRTPPRQRERGAMQRDQGRPGREASHQRDSSRDSSSTSTTSSVQQKRVVTRSSHPRQNSNDQDTTNADSSSGSDYTENHHHQRAARKRRRHHSKMSPPPKRRRRTHSSSSSVTVDSSSTDSDSSSDTSSDPRRNHQRRNRRTHLPARKTSVSRNKTRMKKLVVSCQPPLPDKYCARIAKGEYVPFNKLLVPRNTMVTGDPYKSQPKQPGRVVTNLASWLEAWNRFVGVVVLTQPHKSLEMLKYQTLITAAFKQYPPEACIEYDCCFRQQAANDRRLKWGKYKEDIFIWCFSPRPANAGRENHASAWETRSFRPRFTINGRLGPASETVTHSGRKRNLHPLQHSTRLCKRRGMQIHTCLQ